MILRPYQSRLVSRFTAALEEHKNTLAVAPTGAGKTIMLAAIEGAMPPGKTLILQHRQELVAQNRTKFVKVNPKISTGLFTADEKRWTPQVIFGMVQTLARPKNLETMPKLTRLLIDEAHHVAANSYLRIIERAKQENPNIQIGGVTATPQRGDKKALRAVFDNVSDQISLEELIRGGFLVEPKGLVADLPGGAKEELKKVRILTDDYDMNAAANILNKLPVNEEVVRKWKEHAGDRRTIAFATTVAHAEEITKVFLNAGVTAEMISGETPDAKRQAILRRVAAGRTQVLANVAVLTEGFDCPPISCVVLLRPCSQKSTLIQMVGRGLRTVNPEEFPGVVKKDCIVIDFGNSLKTHGDLHQRVNLGGETGQSETSTTTNKTCPDCQAKLPPATRTCPFCDYEFKVELLEDDDPITDIQLTVFELIGQSPFKWIQLYEDSDRLLIANGFEAAGFVVSRDGETWCAFGKLPKRRLRILCEGTRTQALAAADDFMRENESSRAAHKKKRWHTQPASEAQIKHLRSFGYDLSPADFSFTKGMAAAHLTFQWARPALEQYLFPEGLV